MTTLVVDFIVQYYYDFYSTPGHQTVYTIFDFADLGLRGTVPNVGYQGVIGYPTNYPAGVFTSGADMASYYFSTAAATLITNINSYQSVFTYTAGNLLITDENTQQVINTKQNHHTNLDKFAASSLSSGCLLRVSSDTSTVDPISMSDFMSGLLACVDSAAMTGGMGLGSAAYNNTSDFALASHTQAISTINGLQTALDAKQASLTTGSISQYLRGDLSLASFPTVPTLVSQLTNDSSFITSSAAAAAYVPKTLTVNGHALNANVTVTYSDLTGTPSLATVATSGSYNDLSSKPTIPTTTRTTSALTLNTSGTGATGTQIHATKDSKVSVCYSTSVTVTLGGSPVSQVSIKTCATNSTTESDWTEYGRTSTEQPTTLSITVGGVYKGTGQVCVDVPAGFYVKAVASGSGTHAEAFVVGQKTIYG